LSEFEYIRIPDLLWLPTPVAYDSFTRANGPLGTSEATGPDGQAVTGRTWESGGATWAISSNKAMNAPTEGADTVTDGDMEADDPAWIDTGTPTTNERSNVRAHGGIYSRHIIADDKYDGCRQNNVYETVGGWFITRCWIYVESGSSDVEIVSTLAGSCPSAQTATTGAWVELVGGGHQLGFTDDDIHVRTRSGAGEFYADDVTIKPLTLNTLFTDVDDAATSDVVISTDVTLASSTPAGVVMNLDDESNPQNFVIAYHDGTNAKLEKCVAGTYTTVISAAAAYVAGATLVVIKDGNDYSLYYNNDKIGSTSTISDAGIVSNTKHGLFSTYSGNRLDNFTLFPRGTGGEYSDLDNY